MSLESLHHKVFSILFKGTTQKSLDPFLDQFLRQNYETMFYGPAKNRLDEAKSQGHHIIVLSSAPHFLAEPIAKRLGAHECKATVYEKNDEGFFDHISLIMNGQQKASYVMELAKQFGFNKSNIHVYSDSHLDLPMLKLAGNAVGVKPNKRLREQCLQHGWEIL